MLLFGDIFRKESLPEVLIKWSSYSWPQSPKNQSKKRIDLLAHLKNHCLRYRQRLPFTDDKAFLNFCFFQQNNNYEYSFSLKKFAMTLGEEYLHASLLDQDVQVRELGKLIIDIQDGIYD